MNIKKMNRSDENQNICRPALVSYVIHSSILFNHFVNHFNKKQKDFLYYSKSNQPFICI